MREQAISQKVGNRSGIGARRRSAGSAQQPARRERSRPRATFTKRWRGVISYLPTILKLTLAVVVGVVLFTGYRVAASATFFQIRQVEVQGTSRASTGEVQATARRELNKTGVWNADLKELSAKLERLPWIRKAVVSRVLPDGVRVRIVERVPRAVVRTSSGRFRWVDEDAVLLGEMTPADQMPPFFLRGLSEDESETAQRENIERVLMFLELQRECEATGLSERVSEVNLIDLRDMRAQLAGDDAQIEVRLGSQEPGKRLKEGIAVLDEQRQTPRGQFISYVDLSQGKRAVVGFVSGAHVSAVSGEPVKPARPRPAERGNDTNRVTVDKPANRSQGRAGSREEQKKDSNRSRRKEKSKQDSRRSTTR